MNSKDQPVFPGITAPSIDFEYVRDQRRATLLYYDIDLSTSRSMAAGTQLTLPLVGNSFYVDADTANGGNAIARFQDSVSSGVAPVFCGPGFIARVPFTQVTFENAAQNGKRLRVFYGVDVDFQPGSVSQIAGTVSVIDGGLARTLADAAFFGYQSCGAVAAQYSHIELWNPAGSGKNLFVETCALTAQVTAQTISIGRHNAAYATAGNTPVNKYFGHGALSVAQMRSLNNAASIATEYGPAYGCPASQTIPLVFSEPLLIPPGQGLIAVANTVNLAIVGAWEWYEQGI